MKFNMSFKAMKNIICSFVVLLPLQYSIGAIPNDYNNRNVELNDNNVIVQDLTEDYCDTNCFLESKNDIIEFAAKTFKINIDTLKSKLLEVNADGEYSEYNIGRIYKNGELQRYNSFDRGLYEYLFELSKSESVLFDATVTPYNGDEAYVESLIKYFTSVYDNVDYLIAISIGAAESGYYKVTYMLNCNNIFGGMSSSGLIKYRTIEYGTLSFIRLLSNNYFDKGLNTVASIGYYYCPTTDDYGNKVASNHWIGLVTKAMNYYAEKQIIPVFNTID